MADGVPPASGGERTDVAARPRADDEGLRDAFAALLGLRGEDGGAAATATAVPLPPPRTASPAAPPTPEPPPANDLWAPSDAPASTGEWARPEPLDDPPPSADDFWSSTHDEHPSSAWAPADEPEPASAPSEPEPASAPSEPEPASAPSEPEPASAPGPWMAHNPERDELWAAPVADVTPATAAVEDPASADARPFELDDPRPPDLFLPAGDRGPTIPPVISLDRGDEAAAPSSLPGLQDVGLGGPLNTAMGDLRRLADDNFGRAARPPETRPGSRRASFDESVVLLQEWWAARRRELLPGLGVALLIAVAFAVVLLTRDGDAGRPVGTVSTSVAPAATAPPTLPPAEETTTVPLPEELVPAAPIEPSAGAPAGQSGSGSSGDRAPAGARTQPRPRSAQTPTPVPAPRPAAAPAPTSPPGTPATTQPPSTSAPPTSRPPQSSDPCDNAWTPAARQACLDSRDQGGDD